MYVVGLFVGVRRDASALLLLVERKRRRMGRFTVVISQKIYHHPRSSTLAPALDRHSQQSVGN